MSQEDPFIQAQSDIQSLLSNTRPLLASYQRIRSTSSSAQSPELVEARRDLDAALSDLEADLGDLQDAVRAVEQDPYRYGLEIDEVSRRRAFVGKVEMEVRALRIEADKPVDALPQRLPDPAAFADDDDDLEDLKGDDYAAFEEQRQQELIAEQDTQLDGVFRTVGNLRLQADEMGRELEEQGELLDSVDTLADRVGGKLANGVKKIGWVIKQNEDSMSSCCIAVLVFVLILLLIMVIIV